MRSRWTLELSLSKDSLAAESQHWRADHFEYQKEAFLLRHYFPNVELRYAEDQSHDCVIVARANVGAALIGNQIYDDCP